MEDERFKNAFSNPIFRRVPKKEQKISIDKRFTSMFEDEKFKLSYKVDKRGRPLVSSTDEDLKKYYHHDEEEEDSEEPEKDKVSSDLEEEAEEPSPIIDGDKLKKKSEGPSKKNKSKGKEVQSKVILSKAEKKKLHDNAIDYARGEGVFAQESEEDDESESESEDSSVDEEEENEDNNMQEWGEMDSKAERTEESTSRLALCNMDWDRLGAKDLFVLFSSFLTPGGVLKSVKIYPSEFGKQRLEEENLKGPIELVRKGKEMEGDSESGDEEEESEGRGFNMEKLRRYQLNRLKYYYAVLEFDSVETADKVYSESDGMEYESSATKIDLRFIPEDMVFDEEPKDYCDTLPPADKYRPRFFTTTALQQVKVDLTWDETDPLRKELTDKIFNPKENIDDEDLKAYLASSSESSEDEEELNQNDEELERGTISSKVDPIEKYRLLLEDLDESEKKKKGNDGELEITWGVGLKEKAKNLVKKKLKEEEVKTKTPWEQYLEKKRQKKKERKRQDKAEEIEGSDSSGSSDEGGGEDGEKPFSDDDVDVDLNDAYFKEEMKNNEILSAHKKKATSKRKYEEKGKYEKKESKPNPELELLLMDEDDSKRHFSLKKIIESENPSVASKKKEKKRKRRKLEKVDDKFVDDFDVNTGDDRFQALYTSHKFNIDPSDPNYKKTRGMEKIISEKQKRREKVGNEANNTSKEDGQIDTDKPKRSKDPELQTLIKSVKRKVTQNHANRKVK